MAKVNTAQLLSVAPAKEQTQDEKPAPAPAPAPRRRAQSRRRTAPADEPAATTEPPAPSPQKATQPAGRGSRSGAGKRAPVSSTPEKPDGLPGEKRITLPLWHSLWRDLSMARIDDGIDTTVRIRAMVELWTHDARFRARVDQLARDRAATLSRGRPRTR